MGSLLKFAEANLNTIIGKQDSTLPSPELSVESNPMGTQQTGQQAANNTGINDYSNIGKVGTSPGFTDL